MERILKAFKDLYKCENPVKKHFMYLLLMFLPCLALTFISYIDKDTPKDAIFLLLGLFVFFMVLSLVPMFMLSGVGVEFYRQRLNGEAGFPVINFELFNKGLKVFPLCFVWGFYAMLIVFTPIIIIVFSGFSLKDNISGLIGLLMFSFLLVTLSVLVLIVLGPFVSYIFISFAKDMEYRAEYFNPFKIIEYIRLSFKDTMLVMLKMMVAGIVVNTAASVLSLVFGLLVVAIAIIAALFAPEDMADTVMYTPIMLVIVMPILSMITLIQAYFQSIVGLAAADQYVEVYKNKIESKM